MSFLVEKSENKARTQREIPKKGPRPAVLTGLIDLGRQVREYKGEKKKPCREFLPVFHLASDKYKDDQGVEHNMVVSPFFPIKMMAGAKRGHYFDLCEALDPDHAILNNGAGDLSKLLGSKCFVNIEHNLSKPDESGETITYGNYAGASQIPEDYPVAEVDGKEFTFDTKSPTKEGWDALWDRTQEMIQEGLDYPGSELQKLVEGTATNSTPPPPASPVEEDNDIPF